jgi:Cu+-exporting ATPase
MAENTVENTVVDPVCGMMLNSAKAPFASDYEGMRYYFCSEICKHRFDHNPEGYLTSDLTATDKSE